MAVHAMVYLRHMGMCLSSEELAKNICTNPARVRKVMALLGRAGLIDTREGAHGGYQLASGAQAATLDKIAQAVDARFVAAGWRSGSADMDCLVASGMANVMDGLYDDLNARCLQRLKELTLSDVEKQIFSRTALDQK